uniref:Ghrelin O-acyltransferase-like n=2 Tax=Salarias fasciatus TaxID=181472 RepID=A0A672IPB5_SALFA
MDSVSYLWEQHQFLLHQCFSLPFAFLFYFLVKRGHLSMTLRYLLVAVGGSVLAVVTMGLYSSLLFTSAFVFTLLVSCVDPADIHTCSFIIQMCWQTLWHLRLQLQECYQEPVCFRFFAALSSLMLLTQRITSVSMDIQENQVMSMRGASFSGGKPPVTLLPLISYLLSFTTLLGGPLCSYGHFVSVMEGVRSPPSPLRVVLLKLAQVAVLESVRSCLWYFVNISDVESGVLEGAFLLWSLALGFRIRYYSHWKVSECLNNAAGFGFWEDPSGGHSQTWSGLCDGDFWTTEASSSMSEFSRRWNLTTALWLRRLVYIRCSHFPLLTTFVFSMWWHGLHLGHCVGFSTWAFSVKADHCVHRCLLPQLSPTWRKVYTLLGWVNTQMLLTCIVITVELRDLSGLRLLYQSYIALFPLAHIILLFVSLKFI